MSPFIFVGLAVAVSVSFQPCVDPALAWIGPRPGESVFLVEATGRTTSMPPHVRASWRSIGFEAVVTDAARDAGFGYTGPVVPGDTIWVAPWKHDKNCDRVEWSDSDWLVAGAEVVLRADRVRILLGRRVVDVPGEYMGYPRAPSFAVLLGQTQVPDPSTWLSPRDYFRLISAAPRPSSSESRSRQGLRRPHCSCLAHLCDGRPRGSRLDFVFPRTESLLERRTRYAGVGLPEREGRGAIWLPGPIAHGHSSAGCDRWDDAIPWLVFVEIRVARPRRHSRCRTGPERRPRARAIHPVRAGDPR